MSTKTTVDDGALLRLPRATFPDPSDTNRLDHPKLSPATLKIIARFLFETPHSTSEELAHQTNFYEHVIDAIEAEFLDQFGAGARYVAMAHLDELGALHVPPAWADSIVSGPQYTAAYIHSRAWNTPASEVQSLKEQAKGYRWYLGPSPKTRSDEDEDSAEEDTNTNQDEPKFDARDLWGEAIDKAAEKGRKFLPLSSEATLLSAQMYRFALIQARTDEYQWQFPTEAERHEAAYFFVTYVQPLLCRYVKEDGRGYGWLAMQWRAFLKSKSWHGMRHDAMNHTSDVMRQVEQRATSPNSERDSNALAQRAQAASQRLGAATETLLSQMKPKDAQWCRSVLDFMLKESDDGSFNPNNKTDISERFGMSREAYSKRSKRTGLYELLEGARQEVNTHTNTTKHTANSQHLHIVSTRFAEAWQRCELCNKRLAPNISSPCCTTAEFKKDYDEVEQRGHSKQDESSDNDAQPGVIEMVRACADEQDLNVISISAAADKKPITPLLYDRKTTAALLGISLRSVDYMVQSGKLGHRRIGSRVLIPASQVRRMAETGCPYGVKDKEAA